MAGPDYPLVPATTALKPPSGGAHAGVPSRRRVRRLNGRDRLVVILMVVIPTALVLWLVWLPAIATVLLSFTSWNGIGGLSTIKWIGTTNYDNVLNNYPPFQPAVEHNLLWLVVLFLVATPFGMFLAVLLDKEIKGSRFYQTTLYLPVVLSLALIGFIWQLFYSQDQGLLNAVLHDKVHLISQPVDWYGDPKVNIWAVLVASSWRHVGYVMLLYLAGLKGVDPSLREAAQWTGPAR